MANIHEGTHTGTVNIVHLTPQKIGKIQFLLQSCKRTFIHLEHLLATSPKQSKIYIFSLESLLFVKIPKKSMKVFVGRHGGLRFVNSVMFNCSLLSKTSLNEYRPMSPKLSLQENSCKLLLIAENIYCIRTICQTKPSGAKLYQAVPRLKKKLMSKVLFKKMSEFHSHYRSAF